MTDVCTSPGLLISREVQPQAIEALMQQAFPPNASESRLSGRNACRARVFAIMAEFGG